MNPSSKSIIRYLLLVALGWAFSAEQLMGQLSQDVPNAARKAIARRQEMVSKADEAAMRGQRFFADEQYEESVNEFRKSLDLLPDAPVVRPRRLEYTRQFGDASVAYAEELAKEGRYDEAIRLTTAVLEPDVDPENVKARQLLADLNDPDMYSQAITPEHIERVKRVEQALKTADGYIRIGDYDGAVKRYHEALNYDPYNRAARRGLEKAESHKRLYYESAYDHTRAKFLTDVTKQWELSVPRFNLSDTEQSRPTVISGTGVDYINEKLKNIIIPEIDFEDTPLSVAMDFLRQKSRELDDLEADPLRKGINIIIRTGSAGGASDFGGDLGLGGSDDGFGGSLDSGGGGGDPPITLQISNLPLSEALRYITEIAGLKYKVEPNAVVIVPLTDVGGELYTQVFRVPPSFLSGGGGDAGGAAATDPFADLGGDTGGGSGLSPKKTAKQILEEVGVSFPQGSSAIFNPTTSQLVVRNTQTNIDLTEAYVDTLIVDVQKQIYITSKFVEVIQDDEDTLGFDWRVGGYQQGDVAFGGGTQGNTRPAFNQADFPNQFANLNPLTSPLRSGDLGISGNQIDSLLNNTIVGQSQLSPGVFSIAGVLTEPQFEVVLRAVSQHKGSDLLSAPSVVARSGQRASVEVVREFIYPTEYDPPEIPDNFGGGTLVGGAATSSFPVTPANPAAFETRNVGVTLEVDPVIGADGFTIDLNLNPEVVEFEGFINYGSPINSLSTDIFGNPNQTEITSNQILMPVFASRRVTTSVTIWDGQTVAVGGLIREDVQHIQDKLPILGDLPIAGFLFRTETEARSKRNLTMFVTARLIDPAGQPINTAVSDAITPISNG